MNKFNSWDEFLDGKVKLCGILNVTPDSFSDGGQYLEYESVVDRIETMISQGADIVDVGAESTRPGSLEIEPRVALERLDNTFRYLNDNKNNINKDILFSIDTRHSKVAQAALTNGFEIINDVSAGSFDSKMANFVSKSKKLFVAMHSRSTPQDMNEHTQYENIVDDVCSELETKIEFLVNHGIERSRIMVDPGIGFAKTPQQNIELMENIDIVKKRLELPLMVGVSRKSVTGYIIAQKGQVDDIDTRDEVTASVCFELARSGVDVLRVHNVHKTALKLKSLV